MKKSIERFMREAIALRPIEFAGLATFFGLNPDTDFEELLLVMTEKFIGLRRSKRKEILRMLEDAHNAD